MQRLPARTVSVSKSAAEISPVNDRHGTYQNNSPLRQLAVRIREEQGVDVLKDYLSAMRPFAAPNELKKIAEDFGLSYNDTVSEQSSKNAAGTEAERCAGGLTAQSEITHNGRSAGRQGMTNQLQILQKLMCIQSALNGSGSDPSSFINILNNLRN